MQDLQAANIFGFTSSSSVKRGYKLLKNSLCWILSA